MSPPSDIEAVVLQAVAADAEGDYPRAYALCERLLAENLDYPPALHMMGVLHWRMGQDESAIELISRAISASLGDPLFRTNLALPLRALGRYDEALETLDAALALNATYAPALRSRAEVLREKGWAPEALRAFDKVVALYPDDVSAIAGRACTLDDLGLWDEALETYDRALSIRPDCLPALHGRASLLYALKRFSESVRAFEDLLRIAPGYRHIPGFLRHVRLHDCDWSQFEGPPAAPSEGGEIPFVMLTLPSTAKDQFDNARAFVADALPGHPAALWAGPAYGHDRIRIAYLSADFHIHVVADMVVGLLERHDRRRFHVTAISLADRPEDAMRVRLRSAVDAFIEADELNDAAIAALLREREIDIAVDLQGLTSGCRPGILQHRPAPLQVNFLGYPGTMGADGYDYILADRTVIPPEHEDFYSEKVARLPNAYLVNTSWSPSPSPTPSRAEAGLPEDGFVFCCFNNTYKITPPVFDVWMRLLAEVPASVLWLAGGEASAQANLRREAAARGVDPGRLVFADRLAAREAHFARLRLADLFLDTLPYNAHATAADALWAGLPVLTCLGEAFPGRVGASLLTAAGLPGLVTRDLAEYQARALQIATTPGMAAELKASLLANQARSPLFDLDLYRREVEGAFVAMHERAARGLPPETFDARPV